MFEKTIKKPVSFSGIGLHTGNKAVITFRPAPVNTGIIFNINNKKIKLSLDNIADTNRSITIGDKKNTVMTIEHLTAGIYMSGITNMEIDIYHNEIPALDGSALPFIKFIHKCGIINQNEPLKIISLSRPVKLFQDEKLIIALPSDRLKITYAIDFNHPELKDQSIHFDAINLKIFTKQIAPARTFGFEKEVESLYKRGLALGGSLKNAIVCTASGYMNKKLRFKDECIRHKVLDFIGALAFLNRPINAHFIIYKSGHKLDLQFIKKLLTL